MDFCLNLTLLLVSTLIQSQPVNFNANATDRMGKVGVGEKKAEDQGWLPRGPLPSSFSADLQFNCRRSNLAQRLRPNGVTTPSQARDGGLLEISNNSPFDYFLLLIKQPAMKLTSLLGDNFRSS